MNIVANWKKVLWNSLLICFLTVILAFSVRGLPGNPTPHELNTKQWKDNGPFELSPERGRYALLYALVENHSFHLPSEIASFVAPDVGYINGNYVSIFAPSVSLLGIPGYIIGRYFHNAQFGTFFWYSLFALLNVLLIRTIALRLGANQFASVFAGLVFLFATPSYAYAVTVYEHHISTFLLLVSIYLLIRFKSIWSLLLIWVIYAFSFSVDYPNVIVFFPVALATFFKSGIIHKLKDKVTLSVSLPKLFTVLAVILPFAFLLWINNASYNNPMQLSGTVPRVMQVKPNGQPMLMAEFYKEQMKQIQKPVTPPPTETVLNFFKPRNMINGVYVLFFSPDRGVMMYTPVILFGFIGMYIANKKRQRYITMMFGIISVNFVLYSMWGDPYGGWAFGARYLIPAYAILAIYIAIFLSYVAKQKFVLLFFFLIFSYSLSVNTLGAVTSNANPPQIEAQELALQSGHDESFTYKRNMQDLDQNKVKSFMFQTVAHRFVSGWQYFISILLILHLVFAGILMRYYLFVTKKHHIAEYTFTTVV